MDTGERGWAPAWIIGKLSSSTSGNEPSPATAATLGLADKGPAAEGVVVHAGSAVEGADGRLENLI